MMNNNQNILALDVGGRRIGVAIASLVARLASPLTTIDRQTTDDTFNTIVELVKQHNVTVVVIGLPRGLDGQETTQTAETREFATELQEHIPDITIVMQDEAGTSVEAENYLREYTKTYSKADIDAKAASLILQDYLQQAREHTA
jgi:putative Holliday junction resolvase